MKYLQIFAWLAVLLVAGSLLLVQNRRLTSVEKQLSEKQRLRETATSPRFQDAQVMVTMPDGRESRYPLVIKGEQVSFNQKDPEASGEFSLVSGSWRHVGSERGRDMYEFYFSVGKRLPPQPDERTESAIIRYISFRNQPVEVVSDHGFTVTIVPTLL